MSCKTPKRRLERRSEAIFSDQLFLQLALLGRMMAHSPPPSRFLIDGCSVISGLLAGLLLMATDYADAAAQNYLDTVEVDLSSFSFNRSLPFDAPFLLKGSASNLVRVEAQYRDIDEWKETVPDSVLADEGPCSRKAIETAERTWELASCVKDLRSLNPWVQLPLTSSLKLSLGDLGRDSTNRSPRSFLGRAPLN